MFERFTASARSVVIDAREYAVASADPRVGSEHLLLALTSADGAASALAAHGVTAAAVGDVMADRRRSSRGDDPDPDALAAIGIDLDRVRAAAERQFGAGALAGRLPRSAPRFGRDAKTSLELALREAVRRRHRTITSTHLLLGVLAVDDGGAPEVLERVGVDRRALRRDAEAHTGDAAA